MSDTTDAVKLFVSFKRTGMYRTEPGSRAGYLSSLLAKRGLVQQRDTIRVPGGDNGDYWTYTEAGWRAAQSEGKEP